MDVLPLQKHAEGARGADRNAKHYKWIVEPLYGCAEDGQRVKERAGHEQMRDISMLSDLVHKSPPVSSW